MFHSLHGFHSPSRGIFSTSNSNQLISSGLILLSDSCARLMQQIYEINNRSTFKNINFLFPLKAITVRHVFIIGWIFIIALATWCCNSLDFSCFSSWYLERQLWARSLMAPSGDAVVKYFRFFQSSVHTASSLTNKKITELTITLTFENFLRRIWFVA